MINPISKKSLALLLAMSALFCSPALATSPSQAETVGGTILRASYYLSSYGATCTSSGNTVSVNFNVTATGTMSNVGAIAIYLYEGSTSSSLNLVRTFYPSGNTNMMRQNSQFLATSVTYNGTSGHYYYAVVNFYAQNANGSDTRAYTTSTIRI